MMAAEGGVIVTYYIFTGEERNENGRYIIPQNVTHLNIHESIISIPEYLFYEHPNIVEIYCHAGVKRIRQYAFLCCPRLRRMIIPGVEVVEYGAFYECEAMTYVDCDSLEIIGEAAFQDCTSLSSINLPSVKIVQGSAFCGCTALTDVKFGKNLESIHDGAFWDCPSLERITIPLKNGLIPHYDDNDTFQGCHNLKQVGLVEGAVLRKTVDALLLDEWRNDMNEEVDSINVILPIAPAGHYDEEQDDYNLGEKTQVIREWTTRVLSKIIRYKAQHRRILNEASSSLQLVLPSDIVMSNVLPFLKLPSHTFEGEDDEEE